MKPLRILISLLILALVIACSAGKPLPYEYTSGGATAAVDPVNHTITFGEKTFSYTVTSVWRVSTTYHIHFPDGSEYHWTYNGTGGGITGWSENFSIDRWSCAGFLMDALKQPTPREKTGHIVMGILLMGLSAVNFCVPQLGFWLYYGPWVEKSKLSNGFLTTSKLVSFLIAVIGLLYFIF